MKYLLMAVFYTGLQQPVGYFQPFSRRDTCEKVATFISNGQTANEADTVYYYCHEVPEPSAFVCGFNLFWHRDCYGYKINK